MLDAEDTVGAAQGHLGRSVRSRRGWDSILVALVGVVAFALAVLGSAAPVLAVDAIKVTANDERIEITPHAVVVDGQGDNLRVNTAAGLDGVVRQMSVRAAVAGTNPVWMVFALRNVSDKPIIRWITAQRYHLIGSRVTWPDLDQRRIEALTPSVGFVPQRVPHDFADIFRVSIEPGQTVTYVAELASPRARIFLWEPHAYELQNLDRQLFNGIALGIVGVLGVFLTVIFAANHRAIFPSAALVAWCVLAYLCVDFGFWHKLLQLKAEDNAVYRAATEAAIAASLSIFLFTFLRLRLLHGFFRMLAIVWIIAQLSLVFIAVLDPRLASTFARMSFAALGGVGALLILVLALRGQDRALSLVATWVLFLVWVFGAAVTLMGQLNGDIVVSALVGGLTLIVALLAMTVTQYAFTGSRSQSLTTPSEQSLRSQAVDGAGAAVWEWHARRGEVKVSPIIEEVLGYNHGELCTKTEDFIKHLHPADQERIRVLLWSVDEQKSGILSTDFRIRHADNSYRWFDLEASTVPTPDRRAVRCVGLLRDVTDQKRAQARLMHDAVHDSLTGLPNRELFLDRLRVAVGRAAPGRLPAVIFFDLDKFKSVNSSFGLIVGDSILLTAARRLDRHLGPHDTLGRVGGDQFAVLLEDAGEPSQLVKLSEEMRRSLRAPIRIAGQDVVLTAAIGVAIYDGRGGEEHDLLKDSEIAMYHAKRGGADRIAMFRPEMRDERDDRVRIESDLRKAIENRQLKVLYQPIIYLPTEELAGFEALVRWEHPRLGLLNPSEFVPVAEESDLIVRLGSYVLLEAVETAAQWQELLPRDENPLFVSVNVSSRQLFRQDLIQEIRHIVGRSIVPEGALRLEVTESLVMENPERATEILESLASAGARLALDDFGTGYSSLAYLQRFPFDTIKIDRDLVQASVEEGNGAAIVRSIVALAHELGKKVVAEGVEGAEDVGFLRSIHCEYAQGFYYGEPMRDRAVLDLINVVRKSERKLQRRGFFRTKGKLTADTADEMETAEVASGREADQAAKPAGEKSGRGRPKPSRQGQAPAQPSPMQPPSHLGSSPLRARPRNGQATGQPPPGAPSQPNNRRPGPDHGANGAGPRPDERGGRPPMPSMPDGMRPNGGSQPPTQPSMSREAAGDARRPSSPPPPPERRPAPDQTTQGRPATPQKVQPASPPPPPAGDRRAAAPPLRAAPPTPGNGAANGNGSRPGNGANGSAGKGAHPPPPPPSSAPAKSPPPPPPSEPDSLLPDLKTLPPGIASSLAKLAGVPYDPTKPPPDGKGGKS